MQFRENKTTLLILHLDVMQRQDIYYFLYFLFLPFVDCLWLNISCWCMTDPAIECLALLISISEQI